MGKIYNALEKADKNEKLIREPALNPVVEPVRPVPVNSSVQQPDQYIEQNIEQKDDINPDIMTIIDPHSITSEQFRLLKNNILFPEKGEPPRTIMITSPSPNEGKSFVSANLAASIAQSIDEYVLLIDCDLRDPSIQSMFGYNDKNIKGLSDFLSYDIPLSQTLIKTSINKLTILPAGRIPKNPSELLSSDQMRRMIHEVKLRYTDRYIIIDTPPPYITSETSAIARYVDGIIIVVRQGKTRVKEVQDIIDIYGRENILGVVTNFSKKAVGYGYGYHKYGYGYNYRK